MKPEQPVKFKTSVDNFSVKFIQKFSSEQFPHLIAILFFILLIFAFLTLTVYGISLLIIPLAISLLLTLFFNRPVQFFEKLGLSRVMAALASLPVIALVMSGTFLILYYTLQKELPRTMHTIEEYAKFLDTKKTKTTPKPESSRAIKISQVWKQARTWRDSKIWKETRSWQKTAPVQRPREIKDIEDFKVETSKFDKAWGETLWWLKDTTRALKTLTRGVIDEESLSPPRIISYVTEKIKTVLKEIPGFLALLLPDLIAILLFTPILTVIFILQGNEINRNLIGMFPNRYFEMVLLLFYNIKNQISAYLRGLFYQFSILTIVLGLGYTLVGVPGGIFLGFLGAAFNVIPYLGPLLGFIPVLIMAMSQGLIVPALVVFIVAQLIDNFFTQPVVLARSVQIHPLIAILALLSAGSLLGAWGLVIAIPMISILMVSIKIMSRSLKAFHVL